MLLERLAAQGLRSVYLDGGLAVHSLLRDGLVDELIVTLDPVLICRRRPRFGPPPGDLELELVASNAYVGGFVQNRWRVTRGGRERRV